jgi:hypothetical protein
MLTQFWEGIGGKLADRWAEVSIPALLFWTSGLFAWAWHSGGLGFLGRLSDRLNGQSTLTQVALILGTLLGILASGAVVDRLSAWALRLLEGYWPRAFTPVRRWAVSRVAARAVELEQRFQAVAGPVDKGTASTEQTEQYVQADRRLRRLPREGSYLPTGVGNVLRAAERRPAGKDGLEAVTVWPHLWLLLPDTVRTELAAARRSLDVAVSACVWAVFFIGFSPLAWWAAIAGPLVAAAAYRFWVRARAEVFGDLFEAAFDLYRGKLYEQLRWPLPANPGEERVAGAQLTTYLWRGGEGETPTFSAR